MSEILTVKELSEYLKISENTIYRLVNEGKIPGHKFGDSWRFHKEEIEKLARGNIESLKQE